MTAHDQNDASNSISITSLTMASDCKNSPMIDRSCEIEPARGRVSLVLGCILVGPLWRQFGQFLASAWVVGLFWPSPAYGEGKGGGCDGPGRSSWAGRLAGTARSRCRNAMRVSM